MEPYQQRVVDELKDLAEKQVKLGTFFNTATFEQLSLPEQDRMRRQLSAMVEYGNILQERIDNFE